MARGGTARSDAFRRHSPFGWRLHQPVAKILSHADRKRRPDALRAPVSHAEISQMLAIRPHAWTEGGQNVQGLSALDHAFLLRANTHRLGDALRPFGFLH